MKSALMKTGEVDVHAFQASIFMWGAHILSPVVPPDKPATYQTLEYQLNKTGELIQKGIRDWSAYAGAAGITQYSLVKGSAGVLGRANTRFRWAESKEVSADLNGFGDQVIGPPVAEADEELKKRPHFSLLGKPHIYTGPERLVKISIVSRAFPGELPEDITDLIREVDEASENDPMATSQGYYLFHAENGVLRHQAFGKPEKFDPKKMLLHGRLERTDKTMTWLPEGSSQRIDFTGAMMYSQ